jgi:hypothetical protein
VSSETGQTAPELLISKNASRPDFTGLAFQVAFRWARRQNVFETDELISICWLAGAEHVDKWDPSKGMLSTFLTPRMNYGVVDALRRHRGGRTAPKTTFVALDDQPLIDRRDVAREILEQIDIDRTIGTLPRSLRPVARFLVRGNDAGTPGEVHRERFPHFTRGTFNVYRTIVKTRLREAYAEVYAR